MGGEVTQQSDSSTNEKLEQESSGRSAHVMLIDKSGMPLVGFESTNAATTRQSRTWPKGAGPRLIDIIATAATATFGFFVIDSLSDALADDALAAPSLATDNVTRQRFIATINGDRSEARTLEYATPIERIDWIRGAAVDLTLFKVEGE